MRVRVLALAVCVALGFAVGGLPKMILEHMPAVEYTRPVLRAQENIILAAGTVYAKEQYEFYTEAPVYAERVLVEVGSEVRTGQVLAEVNTHLTEALIKAGTQVLTESAALSLEQYSALMALAPQELIDALPALLEQGVQAYASQSQSRTIYVEPVLFAPFSGTVTQVGMRENTFFQNSTPAFVVADLSSLLVKVQVTQQDVDKLSVGAPATVKNLRSGSWAGVVQKIHPVAQAPALGAQDATVEVEIELLEHDGLRPGYAVEVQIMAAPDPDRLLLPYEAVLQGPDNTEYVYLLENGSVKRRAITTGEALLGGIEVLAGVGVEELVILRPDDSLAMRERVLIKGEGIAGD